jgi:hypothetical protein
MKEPLFDIAYFVVAILVYGTILGTFAKSNPEFAWNLGRGDVFCAVLTGIFWPFSIVAWIVLWSHRPKWGFRLTIMNKEESWLAYQKKYPNLSYESFLR